MTIGWRALLVFWFGIVIAVAWLAVNPVAYALPGPLSHQMLVHILLMNLAAPLIAAGLHAVLATPSWPGSTLWLATILQLAVFLGWHSPAAIDLASTSVIAGLLMHVSLAISALWFWSSVISDARHSGWASIVALLITGKVVCLVAVIFVFAPRALYSITNVVPAVAGQSDQQFAGLLMLGVCPLTYLSAAGWILVRQLFPGPVAAAAGRGDAALPDQAA